MARPMHALPVAPRGVSRGGEGEAVSTAVLREWSIAAVGGAFFALSLAALIAVVCAIAARWAPGASAHPPDPGRVALPAVRSHTQYLRSARTPPRRTTRNERRRRAASPGSSR